MSDTENDPFDDTPETTSEVPKDDEGTTDEAPSTDEGTVDEGEEQQGDDNAETPAADEGKSKKSDKMIPESRLKAAIKDVNDKLTAANQKIAQYEAQPPPDRDTDPDGHERHMRLEISKTIMRDTHEDYDETIAHFQAMAELNPHLNTIVASDARPAKLAYDLAKRDMELNELSNLKKSEEWKQFQEWKTSGGKTAAVQLGAKPGVKQPASKVPPNLNRATSVNRTKASSSGDEELFQGSL